MKKALVVLFLLIGTANAKPMPGLNDYGELISPNKFSTHCIVNDPGISGGATATVYSNGQVSCERIQHLYTEVYRLARDFLSAKKYDLSRSAPAKQLTLRILTLAELNNPENFSQTDKRCMYNSNCASGAYFGRTFYADTSYNINAYVVYSSVGGKYSFISTLKHELMHAILYRYQWNILLGNEEHVLIDNFLEWKRSR